MLSNTIQILLQFRWFIVAAVLGTILLWLGILLATPQFSFQRGRRRLFALFVGMNHREIFRAAFAFCWLLYTVVLLFPTQNLSVEFLLPYLFLTVFRLFACRTLQGFFADLMNSFLSYGALFIIASMKDYVFGVRFELPILIVYLLLCITMVNYSFYNFVKDLLNLTKERSRSIEKNK